MGLKRLINEKFSVRMHLLIILAGTYAVGTLFGRLLIALGLESMEWRFFIVAPVSYLVFFLLVGVWIDYVRSGIAQHAGIDVEKEVPRNPKKRWWDDLGFDLPGDEAAIVIICLLLVVVLGVWVFLEGPVILVDAAFEALIAAGFARSGKAMLDPSWKGTVFSKTIGAFLLVWIGGTFVLAYVNYACPGHIRLSEAIRQCGK